MKCVRAVSSAVRAFGLHPKGHPFKSDTAHHPCAIPFSGDVVQLVRTLPRHSLESHTVTAASLPCFTRHPYKGYFSHIAVRYETWRTIQNLARKRLRI